MEDPDDMVAVRFSTCEAGHVHVAVVLLGSLPMVTYGKFESMEEAQEGAVEMLDLLERRRIAQLN